MEKQRRRRFLDKPMKKWTFEEETKILDYLIGHQPIETPTGRAYYQQLVDDLNWSTEPNLVRFKVNNMQRNYYKTLEWRQATIEGGDYDDEMIKEYVKRRCPHFKKLGILYASNQKAKKAIQSASHRSEDPETATEPMTDVESPQVSTDMLEVFKVEYEEPDLNWVSEPSTPDNTRNQGVSIAESTDPLRDLDNALYAKGSSKEAMELKKEQVSLQWMKLEIEKEKLSVVKEKISLQRYQVQEDVKFKILQLEQQERIKKHQIDKDAEVKKYELSLKYKSDFKTEM